jgi:hypothetical protein
MLCNRYQANKALEDHPHIVIQNQREFRTVSCIGVINGVLTSIGLSRIALKWSDTKNPDGTYTFEGFCVAPENCQNSTKVEAEKATPEEVHLEDALKLPDSWAHPETCLTDGSPVTPDHRDITASGQQKAYIVLTPSERSKGYVRPYRNSYVHTVCGGVTTMGSSIAETYARDPSFYSGTFCCACAKHFPLTEFVWEGTSEQVGS